MEMFHAPSTAFLVVTAPNRPAVDVARFFIDELRSREMPSAGVVVNQCHQTLGRALDPEAILGARAREASADLAPHTAGSLLARLGAAHRRLQELARLEGALVTELEGIIDANQHIWKVPRLPGEVHDLQALVAVGDHLLRGRDSGA